MTRLNLRGPETGTLELPDHAARLTRGIVHLGVGAFARGHTASYTEDAIAATGDLRWGILGVSQRSATVPEQLNPQGGLFTLTEREADRSETRIVASVLGAIDGSSDPNGVVAAIADPATKIVTLTITEKGYHLNADGRLNLSSPDIASDLGGTLKTAVAQLAAGIVARGGTPLTVLSCDNLPHNGRLVESCLRDFASALPPARSAELRAALDAPITFPSSMVDRIVPATTASDLQSLVEEFGVTDEAATFSESFRQWVIEDRFATERPAWDLVGAQFVDDVEPWELAKLRVLNASHSLLAYLGKLSGAVTIAEAVAVPEWRLAVTRMIDQEVSAAIQLPTGLDLGEYRDSVIHRFENPHLRHTVAKVGSDGSQKLGPRVAATMREAVSRGVEPKYGALAFAAWAATLRDTPVARIDDPKQVEIAEIVASNSAADAAGRLLGLVAPDLGNQRNALTLVTNWATLIETGGVNALRDEIRTQL